MADIPVPVGAVGRVGLVAQLRRVRPEAQGRLVLVQRPLGPDSSLSNNARPVFAWQVLVLGEPVDISGRPCRHIHVADASLLPVSQLDAEQAKAVSGLRARQDLQIGLDELHRLLEGQEAGSAALAAQRACRGEGDESTGGLPDLLRVEPIPTTLRALGFNCTGDDDESPWHWSGHHHGTEVYVTAGPDMFGRWQLTGRSKSPRTAMWSESLLLDEEPRGAVALKVLILWREAFGTAAPVPPQLVAGVAYEQHIKDMQPLRVATPTLIADGEVLRAIRRWLDRRCGAGRRGGVPDDVMLALAFAEGMLQLKVGATCYGCPASGIWVSDCRVSLRKFVDIPAWAWRGGAARVEQTAESLMVNGFAIGLLRRD